MTTQRKLDREVLERQSLEYIVINKIVSDALKAGYKLSVWYGNENGDESDYGIQRSTDAARILDEIQACDEEWLLIHDHLDRQIGYFYLVYGNGGWDVIADYRDNAVCNALWEQAEPLIDHLSEEN